MINNSKYKGIGDGTDMIFDNNLNGSKDLSSDTILLSNLTVYETTEWKEDFLFKINEISPKDWKKILINNLGKKINSISGKKGDDFLKQSNLIDGYKNYITFVSVLNKININEKNMEIVRITDNDKFDKINYGDLLFTISSEDKQVGMTNVYFGKNDNIYLNSFCFAFRLYDFYTLNPLFAKYYFHSKKNRQKIELFGNGFTRINLSSTKFINNMFLNLPELSEQNKIRELLTKQDNIIENIDKRIEKTKKIIKYYQQELLSGRLRLREVETINGKEIVVYENTEWKEEKINGRVEVIPEDINLSKNKDIFKNAKKSGFKAENGNKNGLYPFFNCSSKQTLWTDDFTLEEECLLFSSGIPSIHYYNGKTNYSNDVYVITNKKEKDFNLKYVYYFWQTNKNILQNCFQGSGLKHLSKKLFIENEILKFSYKEQTLIRNFLTKLDDNLELLLKTKEKEEKTFKFLQQEFLSGKLRLK